MILVVGATGQLGGIITRRLLEDDREVRILVREDSPSEDLAAQGRATSALDLVGLGAQRVYGDLRDRASLDRAVHGIDTVITTANAAGREDVSFEEVDLDGTRALIDAAKAAGVKHFVYTSFAGSDPEHPNPLFRAKGLNEAHLKASGLSYTILKPGLFMEVWIGVVVGIPLQAGAPVTLAGRGDRQQAFVSVGDVAAYAVAAVDHPAARNAEIYIAGPRSYTWTEATEAVGRVVGRPLEVVYAAPGEAIPLLPDFAALTLPALEAEDDFIDTTETARIYDIEPTSLDAFAARFFGG